MSFETFAAAARHNSGRHFLDSGSAYGRHHEKPPIAEDCNPVAIDIYTWEDGNRFDITASMETAHYLDRMFSVRDDLQSKFEEFCESDDADGLNWFECAEEFMRSLGYHQHARDNVYNGENDLSQVFIWEVWSPEENESDWVWCDDAIAVIFVHTGCDVRGGYSYPVFCESNGEYATALDFVCEWGISEGRDSNGEELTHDEMCELSEQWRIGYHSYPTSAMCDDVERVFEFTKKQDSVIVKLKTGEVVRVVADMPYCS